MFAAVLAALRLSLFSLTVTPTVSFAPTKLVAVVHTEPTNLARSLRVTIDCDCPYFRSSTIPMEGDKAPITTRIEWTRVPAGDYTVFAELLGASDTLLFSSARQVIVE